MITRPLARFICGMLDKDEVFYGSTNTELCLRDMQKLPDTELAKFCLFFLQKLEGIVSGHAQAMLQITLNRGYRYVILPALHAICNQHCKYTSVVAIKFRTCSR